MSSSLCSGAVCRVSGLYVLTPVLCSFVNCCGYGVMRRPLCTNPEDSAVQRLLHVRCPLHENVGDQEMQHILYILELQHLQIATATIMSWTKTPRTPSLQMAKAQKTLQHSQHLRGLLQIAVWRAHSGASSVDFERPFVRHSVCSQFWESLHAILDQCSRFRLRF